MISEPFGFADGLSQPILRDTPKARRKGSADHVIEAGEMVLGYPDNSRFCPPMPSVAAGRDPDRLLPMLAPTRGSVRPSFHGGGSAGRREFGRNGTYLVVRQIEQDPEALNAYLDEQADRLLRERIAPWQMGRDALKDLLSAKMVGRWKDGRSLVRHPEPRATPRQEPDNDFRYAREDPQGMNCPFGAHVRRANPRDTFDSAVEDRLAISNRHRILRVGRAYAADAEHAFPGLMFMALNADIERQFEFVQRNWIFGANFLDTMEEVDPLLGQRQQPCVFTIPTRQGPIQLRDLKEFTRLRGGGYFFMPSRQTLQYLAISN